MKKIYLIRHAQSEANAGLVVNPNHAINITDLGKSQAIELADWLIANISEPIHTVFTSHYVRTMQTAEPYLQKTNQTSQVLKNLYEFNYLDFEHIKDLSFAQIVKMADEYWQNADANFQDSEQTDSFNQFVQRVQQVRQEFDKLADGTYVVFAHGMWIGMLMWQLLHHDSQRIYQMRKFREFELAIRPKNCEVFLLNMDETATIAKVRARHEAE